MHTDEHCIFGGITFEWNAEKGASNIKKHRIRFAEGATVFADSEALMISDPDHSVADSVFILVGLSRMGRILVVVCAERESDFGSSVPGSPNDRNGATMKTADNSEAYAMRPAYDFSRGTKNPYARHFAKGSNLVLIRPEIFVAFPSEEAVNEALGELIHNGAAARAV